MLLEDTLSGIELLVCLSIVLEKLAGLKPIAESFLIVVHLVNKFSHAIGIKVTERSASEWRKANPEDSPNICHAVK